MRVCGGFFDKGMLTTSINSSVIVLIPKEEGTDSVDKFRLIVCFNFIFKIITKILANRLGDITIRIISK